MDPAAERGVEQAAGGEQPGVLVLLDDAVGKAGDDRAFRQDPAGDAFEADVGFAGRDGRSVRRLGDQGEAVQPAEVRCAWSAPRLGSR